jgi:D-lactate dehydrogenase (cytochrome)
MDGTWVAMNEKEAQGFASLRYAIPEAVNEIVRHTGMRKFSTDIAVPVDRMGEMLRFYKKVFERESVRNIIFGHIGESHVHANALPATPAEADRAKDICLELIKKGIALGGTVSAEHGIGKIKHEYLRLMYGDRGVMEMVAIKKAIDPSCILGPGNIFPKELLQ